MAKRAISGTLEGGAALQRHLKHIAGQLGQGSTVVVGFLESATYPAKHVEATKARFLGTTRGIKSARIDISAKGQADFEKSYGSGGGPLHVAQVAFWNEFGTIRTPARPFMRTMIESKSPRWGNALGAALRNTDYNSRQALGIMGEGIRGQLRQSIRDWSTPPNSPLTVKNKGFNKPLIDTAVMIRSADYQVIDGDVEGKDAPK